MFWKIKYKHGLLNDSVVEAVDYDDAKKAAVALYRRNSTGTDFLKPDDVVGEVFPITDENWAGQTYCCDPKILAAVKEKEKQFTRNKSAV